MNHESTEKNKLRERVKLEEYKTMDGCYNTNRGFWVAIHYTVTIMHHVTDDILRATWDIFIQFNCDTVPGIRGDTSGSTEESLFFGIISHYYSEKNVHTGGKNLFTRLFAFLPSNSCCVHSTVTTDTEHIPWFHYFFILTCYHILSNSFWKSNYVTSMESLYSTIPIISSENSNKLPMISTFWNHDDCH